MALGISGERGPAAAAAESKAARDAARGAMRDAMAAGRGHGGDVDRPRFVDFGAPNAPGGYQMTGMQGFGGAPGQQNTGRPLSPALIQWLSMHNPEVLRQLGYRPPQVTPPKASPAAPPPPKVNMPAMTLSDQVPGLAAYGVQTPAYAKPSGYAGTPRVALPPAPYRY